MGCHISGIERFVGQILYDPPYWDDLRMPVTATARGGANDPVFCKVLDNGAGSAGVFAYCFSHLVEQELFFAAQLPHRWKEGTAMKPHIHWCPKDATAGNVVWGLEYSEANVNATFPNTTIISVTDAADGVAMKHQVAGLPDIPGTGNLISKVILCRVFRDAANAADTYGNDAVMLEIDFHYQLDAPGSRQEFVK